MIEWKEYDKINHPPLFNNYLVYSGNEIQSAWLDRMGPMTDVIMWHKVGGGFILGVTHFAEINLPE